MDNSKKLTPEEIANIQCEEIIKKEILLKYPSVSIDMKWMINAAMKQYAAQEVAEMKEFHAHEIDQLGLKHQEQRSFYQDECNNKDALLKEAIGLLRYWRDEYDGDGSFDEMVDDFLDKTTGTEAGTHGKDEL